MSKPSRVVVLVEDMRQRQFVLRYLAKAAVDTHQVRFNPVRSWNGAGEQRVRENYAEEVRRFRRRHANAATALIVVIDADTRSVPSRLAQLAATLQAGGIEAVNLRTESIAHLVPKRNIETWILCLNNTRVYEDRDYKQNGDWSDRTRRAAEVLFQWTRLNHPLPEHCVPSLSSGVIELRRLQL